MARRSKPLMIVPATFRTGTPPVCMPAFLSLAATSAPAPGSFSTSLLVKGTPSTVSHFLSCLQGHTTSSNRRSPPCSRRWDRGRSGPSPQSGSGSGRRRSSYHPGDARRGWRSSHSDWIAAPPGCGSGRRRLRLGGSLWGRPPPACRWCGRAPDQTRRKRAARSRLGRPAEPAAYRYPSRSSPSSSPLPTPLPAAPLGVRCTDQRQHKRHHREGAHRDSGAKAGGDIWTLANSSSSAINKSTFAVRADRCALGSIDPQDARYAAQLAAQLVQ